MKRHETKNLPVNQINRREFLRLMGASLALTGLAGCSLQQPVEQIVPYVRQPEELTPGEPLFYATAMTLGGYAQGLLVESREFRPTKVEGNPLHPASLGASDIFAQASVLSLYDPDRAKNVLYNGQISVWDDFLTDLRGNLAKQKANGGASLRILTETITSPTLAFQIKQILRDFPNAVWHQYEPVNRDNEREGAILAFGEDAETIYRFDQAAIVLSLDADFLFESPARVRYARDFSRRRKIRDGKTAMNRMYAVECSPTITGSMADHRLAVKSSEIENFAGNLAGKFGISDDSQPYEQTNSANWIETLARDLNAHRGASVVIAGRSQPPFVHAVAHALNSRLGNVGKTVFYSEPVAANPVNQLESLRGLVGDMNGGKVETLVIVGGNPVYNAPSDFNFAEALKKVAWKAHLSLYNDETSALCRWQIPLAHELETWSDARAFDGTASIIQPLVAPLYDGKSAHALLAALTGDYAASGYEIVREFWKNSGGNQSNLTDKIQNAAAANADSQASENRNETGENQNADSAQNAPTNSQSSGKFFDRFKTNYKQRFRAKVANRPARRNHCKYGVSTETGFLKNRFSESQSATRNPQSKLF